MKRADEKDESNPNLVTLDGIDGKWFEQPDMLSKYKRRPDSLEDMCYCQFGKMYRSGGKFENDGEDKEEEVEQQCSEDDDEDDSGEEYDPEVEFSYIMTEDRGRGPKLPHMIKLKTSFPKENPMMQKRSRPVAIRFHKVNKKNSPYKYFLSEMMLYLPFRDEEEEFKPDDEDFITDFYFENEERIKSIKKKVMKQMMNRKNFIVSMFQLDKRDLQLHKSLKLLKKMMHLNTLLLWQLQPLIQLLFNFWLLTLVVQWVSFLETTVCMV